MINKKDRTKTKNGQRGLIRNIKTLLGRNRLGDLLVSQQILTPAELKQHLKHQQASGLRFGEYLIKKQVITKSHLYSTLFQQWSLRLMVGVMTMFLAFAGCGVKSARAGTIKDIASQISVIGAANKVFAPIKAYPSMFGSAEKASGNLDAFTKWTGMFNRFEKAVYDKSNQPVIQQWKSELTPLEGMPLLAMAQKVNDLMNQRPYIVDSDNWGTSDYWETPVEFMRYGGDCEDFAIAKYSALRALGVPEERLRVAIVHDMERDMPHAVLILYTNEASYMLDNQIKQVTDTSRTHRYQPIFSINRYAWWLHKMPENTVLASAR